MVAPSDMMDNRVGAIKKRLLDAGLGGKVCDLRLALMCMMHTCVGCCP